MNTVGKPGQLGGSIRCVVSVSMLTEGWDANTVTHVLGVRAFGTQLLCEQVIGRALRRQSYDLNEEKVSSMPNMPTFLASRSTSLRSRLSRRRSRRARRFRSKQSDPNGTHLEIRFPRVVGYRVELPDERLTADFNDDSILELTPDLVGPTITRNSGIIGEQVDLTSSTSGDMRPSVSLQLTSHLALYKWRDPGEDAELHLFGQLKRIAKQWLDTCLVCKGGTYPAQLIYQELADMACNRITAGITRAFVGEHPIKAVARPVQPDRLNQACELHNFQEDRWETSRIVAILIG